jgi:hypothetical protein
VHPCNLLGQIVRHRRPVGFVVGDEVIAKRATRQIERRGDELRMMIVHQFPKHRHEDIDRVRGLAFLIRQAAPTERVVRAIHLRAAVDQKERVAGHQRAENHGKDIIGF